MPVIWHAGNILIAVLHMAENTKNFHFQSLDMQPRFFLSEANVFMLLLSHSYALMTILIIPFWVNAVSVGAMQATIIWFYLHLQASARKIPMMETYSCSRALTGSFLSSFCILSLAYIHEREKCSDFILRRIRSNKDAPRNLEAGVYVGELLDTHLDKGHATIIRNNRPSGSSDSDKGGEGKKEVKTQDETQDVLADPMYDSSSDFGSSLADPRQNLPTAPSVTSATTHTGIHQIAAEIVPSTYTKSDIVEC